MSRISNYIKDKYGLSNYQIAQLTFVFKSTTSELSKILIMGIIFHNHLKQYIFLLLLMCFLRTFSGGIHFYTYKKCLTASTLYIWSIIAVFSNIAVPLFVQLFLLFACIVACYKVGPILSKYRTHFPEKQLYICRNITCLTIFIYTIAMYIIPKNLYCMSGFWMIILHSLQLFVAKIQMKGEYMQ
ncbi:MAG: accessory gene regulator B family protein [Lachnoclostridium sp.]|nr:accessory gene regulator B family protein [Lachnospira sp.]MCM1249008.1 accessory gene regulator B family protein [Lachnoclostridium sp.]